jgi:putative transcriptional regulator
MPDPRSRSKLLRELRNRLGELSQEQLAHKLGVSWSTVSRWENGRVSPSPLARGKLIELMKAARLGERIPELDAHS